jgi:hypothetical protein
MKIQMGKQFFVRFCSIRFHAYGRTERIWWPFCRCCECLCRGYLYIFSFPFKTVTFSPTNVFCCVIQHDVCVCTYRCLIYRFKSLTHGAEPFLRNHQLCSYSRNSQHFMEPEGPLPCSQEPTGPYHEQDQSNPYPSGSKASCGLS